MNYLNKMLKIVKNLCQPAFIYMIYGLMNIIIFSYVIFSNGAMNASFREIMNQFGMNTSNMFFYYITLIKLFQTIFWVFIIDLLCRNKYHKLAWLIIAGTLIGDVKFLI